MPWLTLFRHGKAVSKEEAGSDEARWLTEEGRRDVEAVARCLPVQPKLVLTSPLRRAVETAEILCKVHGCKVEVWEGLRPDRFSLDELRRLLVEEWRGELPVEELALVGHAPSLEEVLRALMGGGRVKLKAGAAAVLELEKLEPGGAVLHALLHPAGCRRCCSSG